jgi:Imidazolonepropionase and related amidohydrolases
MIGECHAHTFMNGEDYQKAVSTHKMQVSDTVICEYLCEYQKRGISYIRDGGDDFGVSLRTSQLAREFNINYRTPVFAIHKKGRYGAIIGRDYESLEDYRKLVKTVRQLGGHFIKVVLSGIVDFEKSEVVTSSDVDYDEVRELVAIAHTEGFAVMAHVNGAKAIANAANCGVDSIEHGYFIDELAMETLLVNKVVWVPTLVTAANLLKTNRCSLKSVERNFLQHQDNIRKASKKGVLIAPGSDAGAYAVKHGQGIIEEYQLLTKLLKREQQDEDYLQKGLEVIMNKF